MAGRILILAAVSALGLALNLGIRYGKRLFDVAVALASDISLESPCLGPCDHSQMRSEERHGTEPGPWLRKGLLLVSFQVCPVSYQHALEGLQFLQRAEITGTSPGSHPL